MQQPEQHFVTAPAPQTLLKVLKGEMSVLQLGAEIQLDAALRALQDGLSLTEIVHRAVCQLERYIIVQTLKSTQGNKAETARLLKVDYKTLYRKMDRYFETLVTAASSDGQTTPRTAYTR